ncbi:hypothetical protein F3J20_30205 [Paraburkholderia sp. Cy-641]|uniref:hypothetical protein n=1 Tax=Paraburkholderia sp. Cy-641 TaxID=2608337 RepID=UPI001423BE3E|nr:hypothetical protein [Paraburkholderia sp. Cy-641]NIF81595.1 hypothetical protein [Paraburkholderia sp. Cy-641]
MLKTNRTVTPADDAFWPAYIQAVLASSSAQQEVLTQAERDVLAERRRQVDVEGWTAEHDDERDPGVLVSAAAAYLLYAADTLHPFSQGDGRFSNKPPICWPFDRSWWKPESPRIALKKGIALALAEMDRIDRDPGDESGHSHLNGGDL